MNPLPSPATTPKPRWARWQRILQVVLLVDICFVLALRMVLANLTTPEALVKRLESQINARVEIEASKLTLFHFPSLVELHGVRLAPRDADANNAVPLVKRQAIGQPLFSAKSMRLEGSPWSLLSRTLDISDLIIDEADARIEKRKEGSLDVETLFKRPEIVAGKPNPRPAPVAQGTTLPVAPTNALTADDLPMATSIGHILLSGSRVQTLLRRKGTMIDVSSLRFELTDLNVHPADLANHNSGQLRVAGALRINRPKKNREYANLNILGEGQIQPFDPATRLLSPSGSAKITFSTPSEINLTPAFEKINKRLKSLKKIGVDLGQELGTTLVIADQTSVQVEFREGIVKTLSPLPASAGNVAIELASGALFNPENNEHAILVTLIADAKLSALVLEQINDKARLIPDGPSRDAFLQELTDSFFKNERFQPVCLSTGNLDDPDVELVNKLPDIGKFLSGLLDEISRTPSSVTEDGPSASQILNSLINGSEDGAEQKSEE